VNQKKLFGLIGYPLTHSFSKKYFTEKFEKEGITDCSYELFPIEDINQFPHLISEYSSLGGLSVTIPYKEKIIPYLTELDETAKAVGAVNCIKIKRSVGQGDESNLKLIGYNTDVFGFKQSIKPFLESHHQRALILGTGGASKAVAYVLKEIGIDCYFVSRNKHHDSGTNIFLYEEINEYVINAFHLIINTTPIGMFPNVNEVPEIPFEFITDKHLLYDLVYNPTETNFLKHGKEKGAICINGLSMLYLQAEKTWEIWNEG